MRALLTAAAILVSACGAKGATGGHVLLPGHIDLARGPDGNTVILDAPDGLIVVDTGRHTDHVERILAHAAERGKPVAAIINTHWHLDHTTGNRDIRLAYPEAKVIATDAGRGALTGFLRNSIARSKEVAENQMAPEAERKAAARSYAAVSDPESFLPAEPVTGSKNVVIAGRTLELHTAHAAVTEADLWLRVPDEDMVIVGDLVVGPAPFFDTACADGWSEALREIEATPWSLLIPGHGSAMRRADFTRWRGAFEAYLACARSSSAVADCVTGWMRDAKGFYTEAETKSVRALADYYVSAVLRGPADRVMPYCRARKGEEDLPAR